MKRLLTGSPAALMLVWMAVLAGCVASASAPTPTAPPLSGGPVSGNASVEEVSLLTLESFPVQVVAVVKGTLPDTCTKVDQITQSREGNTFKVTITTISQQGADCTATGLQNRFEQNVPLDVYGLPKGSYTVEVNGVAQPFELTADNSPPSSEAPLNPAPGNQPTAIPGGQPGTKPTHEPVATQGGNPNVDYGLAPINGVEVVVSAGNLPTVTLTIRGYLPDGCTKLAGISDSASGNAIVVTVQTERPRGMMCTQIVREFTEKYTLTSPLTRGTYTLAVNGFTTQVTIP